METRLVGFGRACRENQTLRAWAVSTLVAAPLLEPELGEFKLAERLKDFLAKQTEPIPHIIGRGILPVKGKMIIGGEPKANKSFVSLNLALDLCIGRNIFDAKYLSSQPVLPVYQPHSVLYIEQEIGEDGVRDRLRDAIKICETEDPPFFLKTRDMGMRLDTDSGRAAIVAEIEQVKPNIVILDPLAKFHLSDENSNQQMSMILRVIDHWIERYNCSFIIIHHTGKENYQAPRRGGNKLRGASAIFGDADAFCEVVRCSPPHHKEPVLDLRFELRRGEPLEEHIYIKRLRSGRCQYMGEHFHWGRPDHEGQSNEPYSGL